MGSRGESRGVAGSRGESQGIQASIRASSCRVLLIPANLFALVCTRVEKTLDAIPLCCQIACSYFFVDEPERPFNLRYATQLVCTRALRPAIARTRSLAVRYSYLSVSTRNGMWIRAICKVTNIYDLDYKTNL